MSALANCGHNAKSGFVVTTSSLAPTCSSSWYPKNISPTATPSARQHRRRAEISIALLLHRPPAAPQAHYLLTRFRALALFGRRPAERGGEIVVAGVRKPAQLRTHALQQSWGDLWGKSAD